jgi:hypothetical protein
MTNITTHTDYLEIKTKTGMRPKRVVLKALGIRTPER